ncbi:MAG: PAS domain S-box protein [Chloroflexi bacterium]|nr:PAS domain S-box protein [Chloroflexota bacterium]
MQSETHSAGGGVGKGVAPARGQSDVQGLLSLLANSSDGACVLDTRQRIVFWNAEAQRILGYSPPEVEGRTCWQVLQLTELDGSPVCGPGCTIIGCFRQGRAAINRRLLTTCRDGSHILLDYSTAAFDQGEGARLAGVIFFRRVALPQSPSATTPTQWEFHCLGAFAVRKQGAPLPLSAFPRRQAVTLLKILLTFRGRPLHREHLMELLWPEVGLREGVQRLKVLIHTLRSVLEPEAQRGGQTRLLVTGKESYWLSAEAGLWVDVDAYRDLAARGDSAFEAGDLPQALEHYGRACALYKGEYLPEDCYEDWSSDERSSLRERHQGLLEKAARAAALVDDQQGALDYYQQALALDPLRESTNRALMATLWRMGRREEAARQFHRLASALYKELGVSPEAETVRLYSTLLAETTPVVVGQRA